MDRALRAVSRREREAAAKARRAEREQSKPPSPPHVLVWREARKALRRLEAKEWPGGSIVRDAIIGRERVRWTVYEEVWRGTSADWGTQVQHITAYYLYSNGRVYMSNSNGGSRYITYTKLPETDSVITGLRRLGK